MAAYRMICPACNANDARIYEVRVHVRSLDVTGIEITDRASSPLHLRYENRDIEEDFYLTDSVAYYCNRCEEQVAESLHDLISLIEEGFIVLEEG